MSAALSAADPAKAVRRFLRREDDILHIGELRYDLHMGHVYLVSVGKAAAAMAKAAIEILGDDVHSAVVTSKKGSETAADLVDQQCCMKIQSFNLYLTTGEDSIRATEVVVQTLAQTNVNDLVLCLISGGTSALLTLPVIPLVDWQSLNNALLASGCSINDFNCVRRQLDHVKGGGLAQMAAPAQCVSLILSDVVGNPLHAIGSGPTVFVDETADDAMVALKRYAIAEHLEADVWGRIIQALEQPERELRPANQRNDHIIVGDVRQSATSAMAKAMQLGFIAQVLTAQLEGEAREVARVAAAIAKDMPVGRCLILGGETTVKLNGDGLGGRNQELALAAAIALDGRPNTIVASFATDGEDGPTPAAGAVVSGESAEYGRLLGLDPVAYLDLNDSYHFFQHLDESYHQAAKADGSEGYLPVTLLIPGPTGTNVNDLLIILTYPDYGSTEELQ